MIIWLASYPKSGNTWLRALISTYYYSQNGVFDDNLLKKIDLHGLSLENANKTIDEFITKCFQKKVNRITVITGKGLRSNNTSNTYV